MNEIMASVSAAKFLAAASAASADGAEQISGESFGSLLAGAYKVQNEQTEQPVTDAETEMSETAAEITDTEPLSAEDIITDDGKNAFLETLMKYILGSSGTAGSYSVDMRSLLGGSIWDNVEFEEKEAYLRLAEILSGASEQPLTLSEWSFLADSDEEETSLKDVFDSLIKLPAVKCRDKKDVGQDNVIPEMLLSAFFADMTGTMTFADTAADTDSKTVLTDISLEAVSAELPETNLSESLAALVDETDESVLEDFCIDFAEAVKAEGMKQNIPQGIPQSVANDVSEDKTDVPANGETENLMTEKLPVSIAVQKTEPDPDMSLREQLRTAMAASGVSRKISRETESYPEDISISRILAETGVQTQPAAEIPAESIASEARVFEDADVQIMNSFDSIDLSFKADGEVKEITVRLAPEELGTVDVKIAKDKEGIIVTFTAESGEAARLIGDKAAALAEALASRGVRVKEMVVAEPIRTNESANTGFDSAGNGDSRYSSQSFYEGTDNGGQQSRHFAFDSSGGIISDITEAAEAAEDANIIYSKEAKLWATA